MDARAASKLMRGWALFGMLAWRKSGRQETETCVSLALNDQGRIRNDPFIFILRMLGIWYIDMY